jgi:hypothetical protein
VHQHPVAGPDPAILAVEEADVDVAPDAGHVDLCESIGLVNKLDYLARDRQAHTELLRVGFAARNYHPRYDLSRGSGAGWAAS